MIGPTRSTRARCACQSDPNDARRQAWNGKWPGEDDCQRLDFFVNGDPDFPDLNRLFTDCNSAKRWVRAFNPSPGLIEKKYMLGIVDGPRLEAFKKRLP